MKSKEAIYIKIAFLTDLRRFLPKGYTDAKSVYLLDDPDNIVSDDGKRHHYSLNTEKGRRIAKQINKAREIDKQIDELEAYWRVNYKGNMPEVTRLRIKVESPIGLNNDFYQRAVPESNTMAYKTAFMFRGTNFRSKNELIIAEILTELGLEYKYEPKIILANGQTLYPDFLVNIEEANRCFMIEIQGMMNDVNYVTKAVQKESIYFQNGYRDGKEILFFKSGTDTIDFDAFKLLVEAVVEANIKEAYKIV